MKTIFIKEHEHYPKEHILNLLENNNVIFNQLLKYSIVVSEDNEYKFKYVGVIIVGDFVISCYPKYIPNKDNISDDFRDVLHVMKKYKRLHEDLAYEKEELEDISFNLLSLMLFFIEDYYENGIYNNTSNILEINGNGEINWDRTINDTFPLIRKNKPYYTELHTRYKVDDIYDYFRLLHEYIITDCSKRLEKANLLDYFDLLPAELSDKTKYDFGDRDFILNKLEKELLVEYNTHKQNLLKSMHAYISKENSFSNENFLTLYGTTTYHVIWEAMCSEIFDNKLDTRLKDLKLDFEFANDFLPNKTLKELIEKPNWKSKDYQEKADETFIPDIITFSKDNFIILDAKYYNLIFEKGKLGGQPGIESISKQYFYELAYKDFIKHSSFEHVKNAFLFPIYGEEFENKGCVELKMLSVLGLQNIQIIMLPANKINRLYLTNDKINDIDKLFIDDSILSTNIQL